METQWKDTGRTVGVHFKYSGSAAEVLVLKGDKPPVVVVPSLISQATAKSFLPPTDCSIWKGNQEGTWNAHVKPLPRFRTVWKNHSEQGALVVILQRVWETWAFLHGEDWPDCCPHAERFKAEPRDVRASMLPDAP